MSTRNTGSSRQGTRNTRSAVTGKTQNRTSANKAGSANKSVPARGAKTTKPATSAKTAKKTEQRNELFIIALFAAAILLFIGMFVSSPESFLGGSLKNLLVGVAGFGAYMLPFAALAWAVVLIAGKHRRVSLTKFLQGFSLFAVVIAFVHLVTLERGVGFDHITGDLYTYGAASNGGWLGGLFAVVLSRIFTRPGAFVVLVAMFTILFTCVTDKSLIGMIARLIIRADRGIKMAARSAKAVSASREATTVRQDDSDYDDYDDNTRHDLDFNYNPTDDDYYVYETRRPHAELPPLPPIPASKAPKRKISDFLNIDDDPTYEESPPFEPAPDFDPAPFVSAPFKDTTVAQPAYPAFEEEPTELDDDSLADEALAGLAAFSDHIGGHSGSWKFSDSSTAIVSDEPAPVDTVTVSDINIEGTGVEGYVAKTVTATGDSGELVDADALGDRDNELVRTGTMPVAMPVIRRADTEKYSEQEDKPYILPQMDLLTQNTYTPSPSSKAQIMENSRKLEETLKSFGVEARVVKVSTGPTVTRYELSPGVGVKVSKISNLADDLALNLAALGIRIEAPVPGKPVVGIEIPNSEVQTVFLRDVVDDEYFFSFPSKLGFAVGKDIAGNSVIVDIAKMPHLLIAGATGAGKSVCINTIIASILFKSSPEEVKMLMIDPKVVELNVYNGIPHLEIPVVTDPHKAAGALSWGVREMNERYNAFAKTGTRDLKSYNESLVDLGEKPLPQIVIIIDELADLMMSCKADVEQNICRLAQKARAAGIHLIIATQRPSVDVITGLIKANVPSRLAFAVTSGTDSRTILDMVGAEKLLGKGDMLFSPAGLSKPQRIQGAFISDKEVERLVKFIKEHNGEAVYDIEKIERITANDSDNTDDEFGDDADEHIRQAIDIVTSKGKASISMLQRELRVGYNRAARMMDMMEERGIVGPDDGSRARKVLVGRDI